MSTHSGGEEPPEPGEKRLKRKHPGVSLDSDRYRTFTKPNYKRLFLENNSSEFTVYVESTEDEKLGNKNPITITNLITENVKEVLGVHRINAHKIGISFRKAAAANNFLKMEEFLWKNKMKAFIPSYLTEKIGVLRFVPKDLSNEEIYKNIVCDAEVISIKRFMRKVEGKLVPLNTVAVTFASTTLPHYAYIKLYRYEIKTYISPLLQCYKCLKFNHSAKVCRGEQKCSSCAGQHSYRDCDIEEIVCINCSGNHLAISRDCPIKKQKIEERKAKFLKQQMHQTYATVAMLEVCIDSLESAINAIHGGADELEVCSSLTEGGLTPSPGLVKQIMEMVNNIAAGKPIRKSCHDCGCDKLTKRPKVNVMIRCRTGSDFCYSLEEMDTMLSDVDVFKGFGVDRFVFGALTETQDVDEINCEKLIRYAEAPVTFHRAFDVCNNPLSAVNKISGLGFNRLLTSGQKASADEAEAIQLIKTLISTVGDKIEIMPGAGINLDNVKTFIDIGCKIVHSSCKRIRYLPQVNGLAMGSSDSGHVLLTDETIVKKMKETIS